MGVLHVPRTLSFFSINAAGVRPAGFPVTMTVHHAVLLHQEVALRDRGWHRYIRRFMTGQTFLWKLQFLQFQWADGNSYT